MVTFRANMLCISRLRIRQTVILRGQNVLSKDSWEAHLARVLYKKNFILPDPHLHTSQPQYASYLNAMIMLSGTFTKVRLWPSSLVVSPQKRATVNQETAEATDKHARLNEQAHGPFLWGKGGRKNVVHQQKRHPDSKASCSKSRLILIRALSECALYRQTEQERHFRWRGWMLRPRVIRSPTNPKWDRSRVRVPLRAACSFCFLFCRLSFFYLRLSLRQAAFVNFIISKFGIFIPKALVII